MVGVKDLGTILAVFAHPDDESFTSGGLLAMAAANGQMVACVTATKGEEGMQDESRWPKVRLGEIREAEMNESLKILGITRHHWLGYKDGHCAEVDENEAVSNVCEFIDLYKPDTIITFAPDGLTGHPDHRAVNRWSLAALERTKSSAKIYFPVHTTKMYEQFFKKADEAINLYLGMKKPNLVDEKDCDIQINLDNLARKTKLKALAAQESQMEKMFKAFDNDWLEQAFGNEDFISSDRPGLTWEV